MRRRAWRIRVRDILEAAERAQSYAAGHTATTFAGDVRTVDAVSYAMVVIGEAARAVPEEIVSAAPEVPWAALRGMRNRVAHEYFGVDAGILWETVRSDLPVLVAALRDLLARTDLP